MIFCFSSWDYFSHDHARSRAYRWGEDGLLGITDRQCRLCFGLALWNGKDPILKERLYGLTGPQGNSKIFTTDVIGPQTCAPLALVVDATENRLDSKLCIALGIT